MRRRLLVLAGAAAAAVALTAPQASAGAAQLCYDLNVQVQDQVVAQAGCLPE